MLHGSLYHGIRVRSFSQRFGLCVCLWLHRGQSGHGIGIDFERGGGQSGQPRKVLAENIGCAGGLGGTQAEARHR